MQLGYPAKELIHLKAVKAGIRLPSAIKERRQRHQAVTEQLALLIHVRDKGWQHRIVLFR